jgi:hypothetical protein
MGVDAHVFSSNKRTLVNFMKYSYLGEKIHVGFREVFDLIACRVRHRGRKGKRACERATMCLRDMCK